MRRSVPEHRLDGSPSPLVGAVIVRSDGSVETRPRRRRVTRRQPRRVHPAGTQVHRGAVGRLRLVYYARAAPEPQPSQTGLRPTHRERPDQGRVYVGMKKTTIRRWPARASSTSAAVASPFTCSIATCRRRSWQRTGLLRVGAPAARQTGGRANRALEVRGRSGGSRAHRSLARSPRTVPHESGHPACGGDAGVQSADAAAGVADRRGWRVAAKRVGLLLFGRRPRDAVPQAGLLERRTCPTARFHGGSSERRWC